MCIKNEVDSETTDTSQTSKAAADGFFFSTTEPPSNGLKVVSFWRCTVNCNKDECFVDFNYSSD